MTMTEQTTSAEVEVHQGPAVPALSTGGIPTPAEFRHIEQMATVLAQSDLVPKDYRGKPANVILASLAGRPFGWDPTMSMRSFHVIEGVPSMKPEIMLALIRRAGHSVVGKVDGTGLDLHAEVTGTRCDNGDTMTFSFSVQDAVTAELCQWKDGRIRARSSSNKIKPWEAHPKSMVWARALSQLARMLFPDVVLGAGYTPEELGAQLADDDIIDVHEVDGVHVAADLVSETGVKNKLVEVLGSRDDARDAWEMRPASLREGGDGWIGERDGKVMLRLDVADEWVRKVEPRAASAVVEDDEIVDAEIVDEPPAPSPAPAAHEAVTEAPSAPAPEPPPAHDAAHHEPPAAAHGHPLDALIERMDGSAGKNRVTLAREAAAVAGRSVNWADLATPEMAPVVEDLIARFGLPEPE